MIEETRLDKLETLGGWHVLSHIGAAPPLQFCSSRIWDRMAGEKDESI